MSVRSLVIIAAIVGFVYGQSEVSGFPENFTLPPELQGKVDEKELQLLQNKYDEDFRKKCVENGGIDAYKKAKAASTDLQKCLRALVDPVVLQQEIEKAKPTGGVDEVFKKYCQKRPSFVACFNNLAEAANHCFNADEQKNLKTVTNVTEHLAEFICHKEGDRIALFIAEGGEECFRDKQPELENCMNTTFGGNVNLKIQDFSRQNIPTLAFDEKQCHKLTELQYCVVGVLDTCSKPTSANIVESLFKYIRKSTPCNVFDQSGDKRTNPNSAAGWTISTLVLALGASVALYV